MLTNLTKTVHFLARKLKKLSAQSFPISKIAQQQKLMEEELKDQFIPFTVSPKQSPKLAHHQSIVKEQLIQSLKNNQQPLHSYDPYASTKLVNRPNKGVVWGLGGQLMLAQNKIHLVGLKNNIDELIQFLELHQVKDIYVHDFYKEDQNLNRRRYSIIGSCFSGRHCWKTGIELKNAFNLNSSQKFHKSNKKYDPIGAVMNGGKNQEWILVEYKDLQVSLMTQPQRQAADLQWKWNNPISEERIDHYNMLKLKRGRRNQFQNL